MLLTWGSSQGLNALMNSAEFIAGFADKGSGEVDLTLSRGTGSATFTRATTATTVNSAGLVVSVASGTPRSYYDPTTLAYRGYLAEGARTNLCLQSQDLATTWVNEQSTETVNAATAPDGTLTADKLEEDTSTNQHNIRQDISTTAAAHTFSVFAKKAERSYIWLYEASSNQGKFFDINAGTVLGNVVGAPTSATIKSYPNGWYRCDITITTTAAVNSFYMGISDNGTNLSYTGTAGSGVYLWGMQVEAASFASSYIPTTTASVPRNADVLTYPFSGNALTATGSAYAEILFNGTIAASSTALGFTSAGRAISRSLATEIQLFDGTTNLLGSGYQSVVTAARKQASSWGGSTMSVTADGAAVTSGAFDGAMGATTAIYIGTSDGALNPWFGTIRNVRIYQTQLSSAQLQAVTA